MRQPVPFGKYLLLDRISVGGMAEVFKAKSYGVEGFEKIIAIKRILPSMGEDREFIKMFIDEAKIAGQLAHANICQIFELGRIEGAHFIAMEYIWGKDLLQIQNRLRKLRRPMPVDMACFMLAKVCEGLDYAHRKRDAMGRPLEIVHRDCSPQNVLVSYEGEVKVIDFGIAKAAMRNSRTMAGVLKGKFGYMSPEQVRGLPLDRRSDIFALGTMLYECLTSDRLFQGETDFSTLEKVRNVDIQAPRAINPEIPEEVERIILKALAKDTEDRYQWCSDMLADLQQHLMRQEVVFTAKTLAAWIKEVFNSDVERERASLEAYKRIGRDGLIAGVPAAAAKLDVVEHLGEAGQSEDPTMLGAPGFEDVERSQGFETVEVGPASGSPAAMGSGKPPKNEFGEEAPTEIFGEISEADGEDAPMRKPLPTARPTVPNQGVAAPSRPGGLGGPGGGSATVPMGSQQAPRPAGMIPHFSPGRAATSGGEGGEAGRPGSQSGPLPGVAPMAASGAPNAPAGGGPSGAIPRAPGLGAPSGPAPAPGAGPGGLPPLVSGPNAATIAPGQMMAPPQLAAINAANAAALAAANGAANGSAPPMNGNGGGLNGPGSGPGSGPSASPLAANGGGPGGPGASGPNPMAPPGGAPGLPGVGGPPPMSGGPNLPGVGPAPGFGPGPNAPGLGTGLNSMNGGGPGPNLPGVPNRPLPGMPNPPGMGGPNGPGFPAGGSGPMQGWQPGSGPPPAQTLLGMQPPPGGPQGPGGYPMMPGMGGPQGPQGPGGLPGMGPPGMGGPQGMGGPGMGGPGMGGPGMGGPGMGGPAMNPSMGGPLSAGLGRPYGVSPYGVGPGQPQGGPAPAVPVPAEGKRQAKKSSVVRDIAIGVSIAAFVLAAFVVIKLTVLDEDEPSPMATMRVLLVNGMSGTLFVDDKTIGPINSMSELPETAGEHKIKVTAGDGSVVCEQTVTVAAGEIKVVDCAVKTEPPVADAGAVTSDAAVATTAEDAGATATAADAGAAADDPKQADAGVTAAVTPDAKMDPKTDGKTDPKTDGKVDGKTDPKTDGKTDGKTDPKVNKPDPKVNKPDPKVGGGVKRPPVNVKKKDPPKGGGLKDL